jgi:hypothetical protein
MPMSKDEVVVEKMRGSLLEACQMAYRKHVLDDDDVGWDELADVLAAALSNEMGKEFCVWLDSVSVRVKPITE